MALPPNLSEFDKVVDPFCMTISAGTCHSNNPLLPLYRPNRTITEIQENQ